MNTSLASVTSEKIFTFAADLGYAGRVFTTAQLARHPDLSGRSEPVKRASEALAPYRNRFEVMPWTFGRFLWRLTDREKKRRGWKYRNVAPSQHAGHWLALGDMWMALVFAGLRPERWYTEGKEIGRFDVFFTIRGQSYLAEVQLSPLSRREWERKWHQRAEWMRLQRWREKEWAARFSGTPPRVLLVTLEPMNVMVPRGVQYARSLADVPHIMRPLLR